jgi:ABC-type cobalamin/Fe3+-siderophores transport system ATPase subunit
MRLKHIAVRNILPVRNFDVDDLSDVVVLAGPNGVGKTRLVDGLLQYFQAPSPGGVVKLMIEATNDAERSQWGKALLTQILRPTAERLEVLSNRTVVERDG